MKEETTQKITTLHDLLDYDASKFGSAEAQLLTILPKWINTATAVKLKEVLQRYMDHVKQQSNKLDTFISEEGILALSINNRVMKAFIDEAEEKLNNCTDTDVKDACLLASIQGINHYKISTYGTAAAFAKTLAMDDTAAFFHEAEVNEKQIDDRLSQLAEFEINAKAKIQISSS
jgi:ferritin-like metal-binding protein YciE